LLSVLFRAHKGVNIVSDFLLNVSGDSASCISGERIPFQELYNVWPFSSLGKLRVLELNKYLNHHGAKAALKSSKIDRR